MTASGVQTDSPKSASLHSRGEPLDERVSEAAARLTCSMEQGPWPAARSVPVAVLVTTKNEQANIVGCLERLAWAEQIVVVDSHSTDQTVPLAQSLGAEVHQFKLGAEGWPKKRNWALANLPWRHEWTLVVDADEHFTPELAAEVEKVVRDSDENSPTGYWINRRFLFMGRWIKHCGYYPSWNLRLFKQRLGRYERIGQLGDTGSGDIEVHEHVVLASGTAGYLKHDMLHYAYPDVSTWVEKHNRYSAWEAHAMAAGDAGELPASLWGGPAARRRWIKRRSRWLPFRPTLRFLYAYALQRGFLDGYPGYCLCRLLAWYEFLSLAKYREMQRAARATHGSADVG